MARGVKTGGRQKGTPNKTTTVLKDAILLAAAEAGDGDLVAYLKAQAIANPGPFLSLLGKVLPSTPAAAEVNVRTNVVHIEARRQFEASIDRLNEFLALRAASGNGSARQ